MQHNLEDLAHHCAHPPQDAPLQPSLTSSDSNGTARSSTERRSSELSHHGYRSACSSGSSYSYNCASTVEGLQSTSGSSHDVLKLSAGDFDAADLRRVSSSGEKSCFLHHDHDMSSTDDEHEHSNASNASCSSQSLQEQHGFSLHSTLFEPHHPRNGGTSPQRAASYHPAGSSGISNGPGMLATPCTYSTEEDPTIIDQSHDAAVSQMSAEILECAARCAQHLKVKHLHLFICSSLKLFFFLLCS